METIVQKEVHGDGGGMGLRNVFKKLDYRTDANAWENVDHIPGEGIFHFISRYAKNGWVAPFESTLRMRLAYECEAHQVCET